MTPMSAASIDSTRQMCRRAGETSALFVEAIGVAPVLGTAVADATGFDAMWGEAMTCHHFRLSGANIDQYGLRFTDRKRVVRFWYCSDKCVISYPRCGGSPHACRDNETATRRSATLRSYEPDNEIGGET